MWSTGESCPLADEMPMNHYGIYALRLFSVVICGMVWEEVAACMYKWSWRLWEDPKRMERI